MNYKIGFIGSGNMAKAILSGFLDNNLYRPDDIISSSKTEETSTEIKNMYGINTTLDNRQVVLNAEILILAIKPHLFESLLLPMKDIFNEDQIIISIAAGISTDQIKKMTGKAQHVYRVMPNTPSKVGSGMSVIFSEKTVDSDIHLHLVQTLFETVGEVEILNEKLIDACIAVQGSSPAYMFLMLEAMGDAGVKLGLGREQAYKMAAQSMLGSAKLLLETNSHPGILKDQVTSPLGTTIEAVSVLEKNGFRSAIIEAMTACAKKSKEMSSE